jgi:hypothetical protein
MPKACENSLILHHSEPVHSASPQANLWIGLAARLTAHAPQNLKIPRPCIPHGRPPYPLFPTFESSPSLSLGPKIFPSARARPCFPSETHFRRHSFPPTGVRTTHTGDCPPRPLARVTNFKFADTCRRVVAEPASLGLVGKSE